MQLAISKKCITIRIKADTIYKYIYIHIIVCTAHSFALPHLEFWTLSVVVSFYICLFKCTQAATYHLPYNTSSYLVRSSVSGLAIYVVLRVEIYIHWFRRLDIWTNPIRDIMFAVCIDAPQYLYVYIYIYILNGMYIWYNTGTVLDVSEEVYRIDRFLDSFCSCKIRPDTLRHTMIYLVKILWYRR